MNNMNFTQSIARISTGEMEFSMMKTLSCDYDGISFDSIVVSSALSNAKDSIELYKDPQFKELVAIEFHADNQEQLDDEVYDKGYDEALDEVLSQYREEINELEA